MLPRLACRSIVALFLVVATLLAPLAGAGPRPSFAAVAQSSGLIPWRPHYTARMASWISGSVDLYDGHFDVVTDDIDLPARGRLDLHVHHVWDSVFALSGGGTAGPALFTNISQQLASIPGAIVWTDAAAAQWTFTANGGGYTSPPGLP